jgi:hypothetical protein
MRSTTKPYAALRGIVSSAVLSLSLLASVAGVSKADSAAIASFSTPYQIFPANANFTLGWSFTPLANVDVTQVGWFDIDSPANGLGSSHDLGIWTISGTLLATQTVPGGTAGTYLNGFWYTSLGTPLSLTAGQEYVIAGTSGSDKYVTKVSSFMTDSNIDYGTVMKSATGGSLGFPSGGGVGLEPGMFGPNFLFNLGSGGPGGGGGAQVPEPGTYAMGAGMGLAAILAFRRRRKMA